MKREPYSQMRIEQILEMAPVTKVTFYRHFSSKADVLMSICDDLVQRLNDELKGLDDKNIQAGIELFYKTLNTDDPAYKKLLTDDEYIEFQERFKSEYFSLAFFKDCCDSAEYRALIPAFLGESASGIYHVWKSKDVSDRKPLDELAAFAARLMTGGLKGMGRSSLPGA